MNFSHGMTSGIQPVNQPEKFQTIDYPIFSVSKPQNANIQQNTSNLIQNLQSAENKNRISLQSIPEFKQQKSQQSKTPQQNSINKNGGRSLVFNGNQTQQFIGQLRKESTGNMQNISEFLQKQDQANRTFYTEKDSIKSMNPIIETKSDINQGNRKLPIQKRKQSQNQVHQNNALSSQVSQLQPDVQRQSQYNSTTINNNNFIITINKNYNSKLNNLENGNYTPKIDKEQNPQLQINPIKAQDDLLQRAKLENNSQSRLRNSSSKQLQNQIEKNLVVPRSESKSKINLNSQIKTNNSNGKMSYRTLSQQAENSRNSRQNLLANKSLNIQKLAGTSQIRYCSNKFVSERSFIVEMQTRNKINEQQMSNSIDLQSLKGRARVDDLNDTIISDFSIRKSNDRYTSGRQTIDNTNIEDITKNISRQQLQPLQKPNHTIQNSSQSLSQTQNNQSFEAYKSVPLSLLPKRKKQIGKLKQLLNQSHDQALNNLIQSSNSMNINNITTNLLSNSIISANNNSNSIQNNTHQIYSNQLQQLRSSTTNTHGSKIIEEEESVNESEGCNSTNQFSSINQPHQNNNNSGDNLLFNVDLDINRQSYNGQNKQQKNNNGNLKNRFQKLTLNINKNQNQNQKQSNNINNPYSSYLNAQVNATGNFIIQ